MYSEVGRAGFHVDYQDMPPGALIGEQTAEAPISSSNSDLHIYLGNTRYTFILCTAPIRYYLHM